MSGDIVNLISGGQMVPVLDSDNIEDAEDAKDAVNDLLSYFH